MSDLTPIRRAKIGHMIHFAIEEQNRSGSSIHGMWFGLDQMLLDCRKVERKVRNKLTSMEKRNS